MVTRTYQLLFLVLTVMLVSCKPDEPIVLAKGITLDKSEVALIAGDSITIVSTIDPIAAKPVIKWSSSNPKVATVVNGKIKALARGTSTIKFSADSLITATCAVVVTKTDLPYQLVWSDEFDGTSLDLTKWSYETGGGGFGNQEKQYYTNRPENLRFENGSLVIEAKKEVYSGNNYTSARINTRDKVAYAYGKFEARISLPAGKGTWPAFWMMGSSITYARWP
ncbi:MAG: Ig-like domain-containing protein, partial [Paludibacter sp.]